MINKVKIYSPLQTVPTLNVTDSDPVESDFIYVLNIDGLDPVPASISGMSSSTRDGVTFTGTDVGSRNIVLTLRPNPDWNTWTPEKLRRAIYAYFTPKNLVKLIFTSDELGDISIFGNVESCGANPFTKDPEYIVSIICSDPYFDSTTSHTITGNVGAVGSWSTSSTRREIITLGNEPVGFKLKIMNGLNADLLIKMGASLTAVDPISTFRISKDTTGKIVELCSIPGQRYLRLVDPTTGAFLNIIDAITLDSVWPMIRPGVNAVHVGVASAVTVTGHTWSLTYNEKYGAI